MLSKVDVCKCPEIEKQAKALYLSAFPKEERLPWWILWLDAHRTGIDLTAWMDAERFVGVTVSVTVENMHFLLFFAVDPSLRGQGYGSAILSSLKEEYGNVSLNIELLDEAAPNYSQRLRRFAFYQKNGFLDTGYDVWEVGGRFRILATEPLDVKRYKKVFRKFSLGFWDVKILKVL